jgi:hypothetical protein
MNRVNLLFLVALIFLGLNMALPVTAAEQPFRHDTFGRVLRDCVKEAQVDYALLKARPGDLDAYLDEVAQDQGRRFLSETDKNRVEASAGTLWLSPIFEWFTADFTAGGLSLAEYVKPMLPEAARKELATMGEPRIRFTDYDWSLNDWKKP